jgi:hypothetical protein
VEPSGESLNPFPERTGLLGKILDANKPVSAIKPPILRNLQDIDDRPARLLTLDPKRARVLHAWRQLRVMQMR